MVQAPLPFDLCVKLLYFWTTGKDTFQKMEQFSLLLNNVWTEEPGKKVYNVKDLVYYNDRCMFFTISISGLHS